MKWKTHIVMVGNKCGTLWKGDTSAVLWVRDILKPRPRVQSVKVPVWDIHTLRPSDVITTNNQDFETSIALQKIKTLSQLCEKKSRLQSRPGQEKCFEIQLLSGSVCFSLQPPPIKYYLLDRLSDAMFMPYQLTRLLRLISLAHLTTKLPFSLSQEQNLLALGNWTHGFLEIIICHLYISHSLCVNVRRF